MLTLKLEEREAAKERMSDGARGGTNSTPSEIGRARDNAAAGDKSRPGNYFRDYLESLNLKKTKQLKPRDVARLFLGAFIGKSPFDVSAKCGIIIQVRNTAMRHGVWA